MRIAIFQDTWKPNIDGVVISTELFMKELKRRGHDVLLVVPRAPGDETEYPDDHVLVPSVNLSWLYPGACLGKFWARGVGEKIRAFNPELIHSMTEFTLGHFLATYWQNKLGLPRVHTFHTMWSEYLFYLPLVPIALVRAWIRWAAPRAARKRVKHLIAPSEAFIPVLKNDWNIGDFPISAAPTGIDLSRFENMDGRRFRAAHGIGDEERIVLYLGRLGDEKNVELVVDTFAELRRRGHDTLRFVIAGDGPKAYVDKLKARAAQHGLSDVVWTGFITGQPWADCYGAAELFLFPSITETQGLVVVESLAAGVPMVSVKAYGPSSTMRGERGCLFAENDPEDFADKAERLLGDRALWDKKRAQGLAIAEEYSIENRTAHLESIYRKVLDDERALPPHDPT